MLCYEKKGEKPEKFEVMRRKMMLGWNTFTKGSTFIHVFCEAKCFFFLFGYKRICDFSVKSKCVWKRELYFWWCLYELRFHSTMSYYTMNTVWYSREVNYFDIWLLPRLFIMIIFRTLTKNVYFLLTYRHLLICKELIWYDDELWNMK